MQVSMSKSMTFPVVISSFEIALIDRPFLEKYVWQYIILDEGHRIKNRNCKLVKELKNLQSVSRLLLTGTPIQNTLEELWSLLNFCSPSIFDNLDVFQSWFGFRNIGKETQVDDIIDNEYKENVVTKLHEILRPFLLRRMKKDVLLSMPEKKEIVVYCSLSTIQYEYYSLAQQNKLRDALIEMGIERAKETSQMNQLMNLRKICLHPFLFGEPTDEQGEYIGVSNPNALIYASGKFRLLDRMLPRLYAEGRKVLIFSQMTELLTILEDYLLYKDFSFCRLDGSTKIQDRQESIDKFNKVPGNGNDKKGGVFAFLLSTRAGGLGINLATADTCILFDSDWNPHADSQAQDRCHRIGQKNNVVIYRLLCPGTCEIEMMEKQVSKKKLERMTIHGGDFGKAGQRSGASLTIKRLRQLLADDVNLGKRMEGKSVAASKKGGISEGEISEDELNLIMDRDKVFSANNDFTEEGDMFDVVKQEDGGILMSIQ
jgi:ATP-dependent DNA helicase